MGAEAAVNAVYANKIAAIADDHERAAFVAAKRQEYEEDIDVARIAASVTKNREFSRRRHGITPV